MLFCVFSTLFYSCKKDNDQAPVENHTADYSAEVATEWMEMLLTLTRETPGFTPPVAARVFGYTGLGMYEAVRGGMPGYNSMQGQLNEFPTGSIAPAGSDDYHWGAVANATAATIIRACYPNASTANLDAIDELEDDFINNRFKAADPETLVRSADYGRQVGQAVVAYAMTDGQAQCFNNNFPSSYVPPSGSGMWVPTPPAYQTALQPYWGEVRPFLSADVLPALPPAPPTYSTDVNSEFWLELMEVYNAVNNLTTAQEVVAFYWSDDPGTTATPPGHSLSILKQVLEKENSNLATAAEAFAKLGMAVHDAFISCWKAKYTYNLIRPITVIHAEIDPNFSIPLITPPFPEYTSGHSVQSGAAAQVLTNMFGDNYAFTDYTHQHRSDIDGSPRSFTSFFDFANEAAISRLYGGIHYRSAIEIGVEQGKEVGANISALNFHP